MNSVNHAIEPEGILILKRLVSTYGIAEGDRETIRRAWMEHGAAWLEDWPDDVTPWALEAFGPPDE